ncbi:MAG: cytoplasmic chaperone TorD [Nitrobacter sp.]|uniref:Cro/CI family transcriptional regulator n=1 Tax=Nitrobacter sp. TaxID=29420 RepID=UPI00387DF97C
MRDAGLNRAIQVAGGQAELARRIGITQPSVSSWNRVPAERVIAVEAVTGISRIELRPDLYSELAVADDVDDVNIGRAREYALLSTLLSRAPSETLLAQIARLRGDATPLGSAHARLADAASTIAPAVVEREYFDLFLGLGRGELLPYASFYLTGFLNERPLSRLRQDLATLGIERVETNYEPEDHAATLCEIMAALAGGRIPASEDAQRLMFEKHIAPWMGRLFSDMENAAAANFYRSVGSLGRLFLEIEAAAFTLTD